MVHLPRKRGHRAARWCAVLLCAAVLFAGALVIGAKTRSDFSQQSAAAVKSAVLGAAVQCYSVEGAYPASLQYLEQNYGLIINRSRYIVTYEAFSDNLLPQVTVLVKGQTNIP